MPHKGTKQASQTKGSAEAASDDPDIEQSPSIDIEQFEAIITRMTTRLDQRFAQVDSQFDDLKSSFKTKLDGIDTRFKTTDRKLIDIDGNLRAIDTRLHKVENAPPTGPPKKSFVVNPPKDEDPDETEQDPTPDTPVVVGKIQKIPADVLLDFNPDDGATTAYCENLRRLSNMYGESSIIAAIPQTLKGRALDWFNANTMDKAQMRTVNGWIQALKDEFKVNLAVTRKRAQARKYDPDTDASVLDYYYNKVNLIKSATPEIEDPSIVDEVWLGLPAEFRLHLNSNELRTLPLKEVALRLQDKDWSFRPVWKKQQKQQRNRDRIQDRTSKRGDSPSRLSPRRYTKPSEPKPSETSVQQKKEKDKGKGAADNPIPEILPKDQWRTDKKGRTMTRKCRYCNKWHFDFECPRRPASYHVSLTTDQYPPDSSSSEPSSDEDEDESEEAPSSGYFNTFKFRTYSNGQRKKSASNPTKIPNAESYVVQTLASSPATGSGVAYLSAEPCPVKAWIGQSPNGKTPLVRGVADTGGPSLISKHLVPKDCRVRRSPLKPTFHGVGNNKTGVLGYAVIPMYFPNAAAISGDKRSARVLSLEIEFQVVEHIAAGFLIGRDVTRAHKAIIDEDAGHILLPLAEPPFKVPIADIDRFDKRKFDSRVQAAEKVIVKPHSEEWVPIKFNRDIESDLFLSPVRNMSFSAAAPQAHCSYSVLAKTTTHLLMINPTDRPAKVFEGQLIGTVEPFKPNTRCSYFNAHAPLLSVLDSNPVVDPSAVSTSNSIAVTTSQIHPMPVYVNFDLDNYNKAGEAQASASPQSSSTTKSFSEELQSFVDGKIKLEDIKDSTLAQDTVKLEWHPALLPESVDPFGMDHEFKEEGPLLESSESMEKEEGDLKWDVNPKLNRQERRAWLKLLRKFISIFAGPDGKNIGKVSSKFDFDIDANLAEVKSQQPYRTSPRKRQMIREAVRKLEDLDIVEPATADTAQIASPVVIVIQKGKPRFCIDFREVNSKTKPDRYALPRQDSIFRALSGAVWFTLMDANKGYHQFGLTERAKILMAFVTEDGLWVYNRLPFGLKNAPSHFQRAIDTILGRYRLDFALAYIDDIIIFSRTLAEHLLHVEKVLEALKSVGLTLDEKKCHFCYDSLELLGHRVSRLGLRTIESKVRAITSLPFPKTIKKAMEILGMFNYYRNFIKYFAWIAAPLYDGLKKQSTDASLDAKARARIHGRCSFPDTPEARSAFEKLKEALTQAPVLIHPDFERGFILYTDACKLGVAGTLAQISLEDNKEHPVLFISRRLNIHEQKYTSTELECLALVWTLNKLAHYVDGGKLTLVTDHSALKWIWGVKSDVNARLFKWSLQLSVLKDNVTIIHRPGSSLRNVDPLSRNPTDEATNVASYHVTLVHLADEWLNKVWDGYAKSKFFSKVIADLQSSKRGQPRSDVREEPGIEGEIAAVQEEQITLTDGTFSLIGKALYFSERKQNTLRLCIPEDLVSEVLRLNHDAVGHPGIRRTYLSLHLRYYFRKMSRIVRRYVNDCVICQTSKPPNEIAPGLLYPIPPTDPFHTLSFDFITDLPESNGSDAILTVTDKFTKAIRLIACQKTTTAEDTAHLYFHHCYPIMGLPVKIISDRDPRFTSAFWSTLMQLLGISQGLTAAFHPQADGQAEKSNQIVEIALRCFLGGCESKYSKWTDYLPILEHEYNATIHAVTGEAPNTLRFAMPLRGIQDIISPTPPVSESAETYAEILKNARDDARDSIILAQRKYKKYYDQQHQPKEFNVGDLVLLKYKRFGPGYKAPTGHRHKLAPISTPLRITEKLSPLSYRLLLPAGSKMHDVVSIIHLRRYKGNGDDIRPLAVIAGDENDTTAEWEVEEIQGERSTRSGPEFLVKWRGYNDQERTWEPVDHLANAQKALNDWIKKKSSVHQGSRMQLRNRKLKS